MTCNYVPITKLCFQFSFMKKNVWLMKTEIWMEREEDWREERGREIGREDEREGR